VHRAKRWPNAAILRAPARLRWQANSYWGYLYIAAYPSLLVLLAGHALAAMFGPVASMLVLIERQYSAALILGVTTLLNAVLTMLLAHWFGALGAAFASSLSLVASYGALYLLVRDQFKDWPDLKDTTPKLGA